jgi:hypothetical protein
MAILKVKDANGNWEEIPAIVGGVGPQGPAGPTGPAATVNGVNALKIQGGDGIEVAMSGSTLTIKAKTVEEWTFTVEGEDGVDTTVTKKVVLV